MAQKKTDSKYVPGQVWSYRARPGEESSTVVILQVDTEPRHAEHGTIVHIAIQNLDGLLKKHPEWGSLLPNDFSHAPIWSAALDESVVAVKGQLEELPDFKEGYEEWKVDFDEGNAGAFFISVAEIVEHIIEPAYQGVFEEQSENQA